MRAAFGLAVFIASSLLLPRVAAQAPNIDASRLGYHTLGTQVDRAAFISVLKVEKVNREKRVITFSKVADLKGKQSAKSVDCKLADDLPARHQQQLLDWADAGGSAICFGRESRADLCLGNCWFSAAIDAPATWTFSRVDETDELAYIGPVSKLREHVEAILADQQVVVTASALVPRGSLYDAEDTPIVREWLYGKKDRVWRVKASLKLIDNNSVKNCPGGYFVGWATGGKEIVPDLAAALKHAQARVRAEAAEDLGQLGSEAQAAIPALRAALDDENGFVRVFAAEALARVNADNPHTLPALLDALKSKQSGVRAVAVAGLMTVPPSPRIVTALLTALRTENDKYARTVIVFALGRLAPDTGTGPRTDAVKALGKALRIDPAEDVRRWAASALLKLGPDAKTVLADVRAALRDKSETVAVLSAHVAFRLGDDGRAALAEALGDKGCRVHGMIAEFLCDLGPHSQVIVPALRKALEDEDAYVRWSAAEALVRIDRATGIRLGVPVLARLAADKEYVHRKYVIEAISELGPDARAAVPTLIEILKSNDKAVFRRNAAEALGKIGPDARAAVPALIEALDSDKHTVVDYSVTALGQIGPAAKAALPPLRKRLAKASEDWRVQLAVAIAGIGDKRLAAAALLDEALNGKRRSRETALMALGKLGPDAAEVLPELKKALRDEDDWARRWIAYAVMRIGRRVTIGNRTLDERQEAIDVLSELVRQPDRRYGMYGVVEVVRQLGPDAAPLVPAFVASLKDRKPERYATLDALRRIGPAASEAVPVLKAILKDEPKSEDVAVTLAHIGQPQLAAAAVSELVKSGETEIAEGAYWSAALENMALLGRDGKPAVPFLLRAMRHDRHGIYAQAARTLLAIDPKVAAEAGVYDPPREPRNEQIAIGLRDDD